MQSSTTQTAVALGLSRRGCQAGNRGLPPTYSRKRLSRYGPLLLWATLIFIGSTSVLSASNTSVILRVIVWLFPQTSPATLGTIHFLIRKTGHLAGFANQEVDRSQSGWAGLRKKPDNDPKNDGCI